MTFRSIIHIILLRRRNIFTDIEVVNDYQKLRSLSIVYFIDFCEMADYVRLI